MTEPDLSADARERVDQFAAHLFDSVLFPRTLENAWDRLLRVVDPGAQPPWRAWLLRRALRTLNAMPRDYARRFVEDHA
jgi:hypothetical protein